ncbi:hypothetical protein DEO72_LG8g2660 [Vigna unguiculata]|uniref:Uncharacterized protein n=1 Tax=Vigna unguiculata TaxID=3917 RepID=A0A4D6MT78_VIGUN|nr:hypothetical protein DEO72_LG8g2660 [Vigna unguiculata]
MDNEDNNDMSFTEFNNWCKRKLKSNYRVIGELKDQLTSMEEDFDPGDEEPESCPFEKA